MLKPLTSPRIPVALFSRAKHTGYYSMERVLEAVHKSLPPHIDGRIVVSPTHAQGFWRRLWCATYVATKRSLVNHITGDISFAALALPGNRTILTVHDFDRLYSLTGLRAALFRLIYFELPFRRSRLITAISPQIAREIEQLFPWAKPKTVVIPDCLPAGFRRIPKDFCCECPTVLQIGTKPNKNLESLVPALQGLSCELHVVGPLSEKQRSILRDSGIRYRNSVDLSETDLLKAYGEADIVSFVSTYEGFGLPILEANAIGRPVLTSDLPPMSEVAGQAACLANPDDIESIRQGLIRITTDREYRSWLVEKGYENAARYSADEIARQFAVWYETIAAEHLCDPQPRFEPI